ncbi:MAG: cation-translocating P-type ATPase C-terminal domain-containing protein, partial [Polyangiaceae bacterium]|nr:cation-translocating P-type ATPase C-terminal domain-containing protein [Polyangiaceae bacterium]
GVDPPDPTQMQERPRPPSAELLGTRDWLGIAAVGAWMGAAGVVCYGLPDGAATGAAALHGRALSFSLLALSPLFHAMNCRSASSSILALRPMLPRALVGAVVVSAGIHLLAVLVPGLRPVFQTFSMTRADWVALLVLAASVVPVIELLKAGERLLARSARSGEWLGPPSRRGP